MLNMYTMKYKKYLNTFKQYKNKLNSPYYTLVVGDAFLEITTSWNHHIVNHILPLNSIGLVEVMIQGEISQSNFHTKI